MYESQLTEERDHKAVKTTLALLGVGAGVADGIDDTTDSPNVSLFFMHALANAITHRPTIQTAPKAAAVVGYCTPETSRARATEG
jgi:hypothetical protein